MTETKKCDPCDGGSIDCAYCEHKPTRDAWFAASRTCRNCLWSDNPRKCSDACIQCGPGVPAWKPRVAEAPVLFPVPAWKPRVPEAPVPAWKPRVPEAPVPVVTEAAQSPMDKQVGGSHYKGFKIQPLEFATVNGLSFLEGNAVKYTVRKKGDKAKRIEDLRKAIDCIEKLIDFVERDLSS